MKTTEITKTIGTETEGTKKVSLRQPFIKGFAKILEVEQLILDNTDLTSEEMEQVKSYFNNQIAKKSSTSKAYEISDKGQTILEILLSYEGEWRTGKQIAEGSNGLLKSNGVSGAIRGLVSNDYVSANNDSPKKYMITQKGVDYMNDTEGQEEE
jgi:predicted transcriptional regulator